jgi:hypothetical protein
MRSSYWADPSRALESSRRRRDRCRPVEARRCSSPSRRRGPHPGEPRPRRRQGTSDRSLRRSRRRPASRGRPDRAASESAPGTGTRPRSRAPCDHRSPGAAGSAPRRAGSRAQAAHCARACCARTDPSAPGPGHRGRRPLRPGRPRTEAPRCRTSSPPHARSRPPRPRRRFPPLRRVRLPLVSCQSRASVPWSIPMALHPLNRPASAIT